MVLSVPEGQLSLLHAQRGGWNTIFGLGLPQPHSAICLIPLWLAILKRPSRVPGAACRSVTRAPPNRGVMRPWIAALWNMPLSRPHGVAIVLIYPCGKAQKPPPFSSRFIVSDRSSPSRVRSAASRPGRLRADPRGDAVHEGKGGGAGRVHGPKGNLSVIPAALSRSRGALSPAGP